MQTFGIELEIIPAPGFERSFPQRVLNALREAGINARSNYYSGSDYSVWQVKPDSSVYIRRNGQTHYGCEIVSPVMNEGQAAFDQIAEVCNVLTQNGAKVNRNCGMHVHVGIRQRSADEIRNVVRAYGEFKDQIDSVLPLSRRNAAYAQPVWRPHYREAFLQRLESCTSIQSICSLIESNTRNGRYAALSLSPFRRIGTIEFRQHSGTYDALKAVNWAKWCLAFVEKFSAVNVHSQPAQAPVTAGHVIANVIGRGEPRMPRRGDTRTVLNYLQAGGVLNDYNVGSFLSASASGTTAAKWVKQIARSWGHSFVQDDAGDWALAANTGSEPATVVEPFQQCFNIGAGLMQFYGRRRAALA